MRPSRRYSKRYASVPTGSRYNTLSKRLDRRGETFMAQVSTAVTYKSPLHEMTHTTPTCLWNDSAAIQELTYSIENGAVGATCNPVIVLGVLKAEMPLWRDRTHQLIRETPVQTESEIAWQLVREISARSA